MKVTRAALRSHLDKIICGGQVNEAVFSDGFGVQALTPDLLLLILAPSIPGAESMKKEIGISDLPRLRRALGFVPAEEEGDEDTVELQLEDNRLVIEESGRGTLKIQTARPKTISTRPGADTVEKLMAQAPTGKGIRLTRSLIDGIRNTWAGFDVQEVEVFVGPKGGMVRVGNSEVGDFGEFPSKDLKAKQKYSLLFGAHFVNALEQVTDEKAELLLAGPGKFVIIKDGDYRFLLSPRVRGADEKRKKKPDPDDEE